MNRELREELYATQVSHNSSERIKNDMETNLQRELDKLRQLTESMKNEEKEAELEKLRNELIEATKWVGEILPNSKSRVCFLEIRHVLRV